jgi:hypothetical protein
MSEWSWASILGEREFWPLHFGTFEPFGVNPRSSRVRELAEALFFVETVKRIRPARDRASLDVVRDLGPGLGRTMALRQLAVARLPRKCIRLVYPGGNTWRIEYGPQGSVAHYLESATLGTAVEIGSFSGHPSLPVLRLAEWEAMIDALVDADVPRPFVPLLLFAGVGDVDRTLAKELLGKRAGAALTSLGVLDPEPLVAEVFLAARWRHLAKYGWITSFSSSHRNPSGDHAGASWRRLARKTNNPEHWRMAEKIKSEAWKVHHEFRALREFFDTLGLGGPG